MNYKEAFSIDEIHYNDREDRNIPKMSKYDLNNFDNYDPKLIEDFYLKYFMRELIVDIDVLEVKLFLDYHYFEAENPSLFLDILKYKVLPKAKDIISNAQPSFTGFEQHNEKKLKYGFVETEGRIINSNYEYNMLYHIVGFSKLQEDILSRIEIISIFIEQNQKLHLKDGLALLHWKGKPSHLAYIISQFINEGYITAPLKNDGEINNTELSRMMLNSFNFSPNKPKIESLRRYSNGDYDKNIDLHENFKKHGFYLPNSKYLG